MQRSVFEIVQADLQSKDHVGDLAVEADDGAVNHRLVAVL
jgi:hypothetical protein